MNAGDRVRVRGGDSMAGTVVALGPDLSLVRWDNGQVLSVWTYTLVPCR